MHLNKATKSVFDARAMVHNLTTCPKTSSVCINLSLDTPLNNDQSLNIRRPAVLR